MKNNAINSNSYALAKSMLHPSVSILNAYVWGKWLCLQLDSGVRFMIENNYEKAKTTIAEGIPVV